MPLHRFTTSRSIKDGQEMFKQRILDAIYIFEKYNDELIERSCPICDEVEYKLLDTFHKTFNVVSCKRCNSEYVNPSPSADALNEYYSKCESNKQNIKMWKKRSSKKDSEHIHDQRLIELKNLGVEKHPLKILEIGCGSGHFLEKVKNIASKDSIIEGIDLDQNAVDYAKGKGLNVKYGNIEKLPSSSFGEFDVILHFELLEHLNNPKEFLLKTKSLLKENGTMIFTTPNGNGVDNIALPFNFKGRMMAHAIFPPMHLNSFNTSNIFHLLLSSGYKVEKISTPGLLDVDMINSHREFDRVSSDFDLLSELDELSLEKLQILFARLNASGHMLVISKK